MYNICNTYNVLKLRDEKVVIPFFFSFSLLKKKKSFNCLICSLFHLFCKKYLITVNQLHVNSRIFNEILQYVLYRIWEKISLDFSGRHIVWKLYPVSKHFSLSKSFYINKMKSRKIIQMPQVAPDIKQLIIRVFL